MSRRLLLYVFLTGMLIQPLRGICQNHAPVSRKELLQQYMDDLKSRPDDFALREQIIKLVATMPDKPKVTQNEYVLLGQAKAALTGATGSKDLSGAIKAFKQLSVDAPWLANVYFDLAKVEEDNEQYKDAIANLKLYLLADPQAANPEAIAERIGADQEAAKRPAQQAASAGATAAAPPAQANADANTTSRTPPGWSLYRYENGSFSGTVFLVKSAGRRIWVRYEVDPSAEQTLNGWSKGDSVAITLSASDPEHRCTDTGSAVLTDESNNEWTCGAMATGGDGTISSIRRDMYTAIYSHHSTPEVKIRLGNTDPGDIPSLYIVINDSNGMRMVENSWRVGDRVYDFFPSNHDECLNTYDGMALTDERTGQTVCVDAVP